MTNNELELLSAETDAELANVMADSLLLPDHLRFKISGSKGNKKVEPRPPEQIAKTCFLLIRAARQWGFDPLSLAQATYEHMGKYDYEGRVYAAVVNTRAGLVAPLDVEYEYSQTGGHVFAAKIFGTFAREGRERSVRVTLEQGKKTGKSENWQNDPEQQLFYYGCRRWVKRHAPEIGFGVDMSAEGPQPDNVAAPITRPAIAQPLNDGHDSGSIKISPRVRSYLFALDQAENDDQFKEIAGNVRRDDQLTDDDVARIYAHGGKCRDRLNMKAKAIESGGIARQWEARVKECETPADCDGLDEQRAAAVLSKEITRDLSERLADQIAARQAFLLEAKNADPSDEPAWMAADTWDDAVNLVENDDQADKCIDALNRAADLDETATDALIATLNERKRAGYR